jgi:hypothetical protein
MVYYTSGTIETSSLDIVCNKKQYTISSEISEEEINEIVSKASQASFGVGNKEVVDLEIKALQKLKKNINNFPTC